MTLEDVRKRLDHALPDDPEKPKAPASEAQKQAYLRIQRENGERIAMERQRHGFSYRNRSEKEPDYVGHFHKTEQLATSFYEGNTQKIGSKRAKKVK